MSWNRDLTLDEALNDPMIAAALRADRVDPRQFETLLRTTAHRLAAAGLDAGRAPASQRGDGAEAGDPDPWSFRPGRAVRPAAFLAARACRPAAGDRCAW